MAPVELEPRLALLFDPWEPIGFAARWWLSSVAHSGEEPEEQTLVHQLALMVALIQVVTEWRVGSAVERSVGLGASEQLEGPELLAVFQHTAVAATGSRFVLFARLGSLETVLGLRAAVAVGAGAERHTAGAIPN